MVNRGEIWWAELPDPVASEPGYRRPVIIIQSNYFNESRINTVVVVAITSNERLALAPGNVKLPGSITGLPKDSVANVSQIITLDKQFLTEQAGQLNHQMIQQVDAGIRLVLSV